MSYNVTPCFSLQPMHMASPVKANTYRVYLNDEMAGLMGKICESTELAQSDLLSKLVAATTAMEAGHSETMLFAHYRALVTPEAAAEFWAIRPSVQERVAHGVVVRVGG